MRSDFLDRFLSHVSKDESSPCLDDLKLIANALVKMHDYGVSFKTAFGLADRRGRKPKRTKTTLISDSLQLMSCGFLGSPLFLNSFLSKVNQELMPKTEDLKRVANALLKMRDDKKSFKSAFGILKKTGHKQLDSTQIPFRELVSHEKWVIFYTYKKYHAYKKLRTKKRGDTPITLIADEFNLGERQIERILAETKECVDIYVYPIKIKQHKSWKLYFSSRKHFLKTVTLEVIKSISQEIQCDEWGACLKLADLYEEAVIQKKICTYN